MLRFVNHPSKVTFLDGLTGSPFCQGAIDFRAEPENMYGFEVWFSHGGLLLKWSFIVIFARIIFQTPSSVLSSYQRNAYFMDVFHLGSDCENSHHGWPIDFIIHETPILWAFFIL